MYTLRIVQETRMYESDPLEQVVENHELGSAYSKIKKGLSKEFYSICKDRYPNEDLRNVEAIICGENGKIFFIESSSVNERHEYFIMTESGKTFERI
jgi:hypothetical protein